MEIPTPRVEVITLPPGKTLGLRFMPPTGGVVQRGLDIACVTNRLFGDSIHAGDLLVAVAGQSVDGMGYANAVELIQRSPRPLDLSFEICVACGSELPTVVVIELPAKVKLGVRLKPPKDGVIDHGLSIDNINNPLLEGKVDAGDLIVAIGGRDVDGMGFSSAIDLIRKLPRPLAISFEIDMTRRAQVQAEKRRAQQSTEELDKELAIYGVVFDYTPMGLNLETAERYGMDGAVVRALKGQAKTNGQISIGDIVLKVNDTEVLLMPYTEVMEVLRKTPFPKTLQFVRKDKLADVQRMPSRKMITSGHMPKLNINVDDDNKSTAQLILDNQNATIKKGRVHKQGRVMHNWKSRYFVLSVSKIEYFKSPSSTTSRGELSFVGHRCSVRSLRGSSEVVCKSPNVVAEFLLELRVDDRKLVMACTSESDKKSWMDALKLAIDASKTVGRTASLGESLNLAKQLRNQRSNSISAETFLDRNAGCRLPQFNYEAFPTPVLHVTVVSATNLTKSGSSVNALCEITLNHETFRTVVVKGQRSPVWKQDNSVSFEAPSEDMVIEVRLFDEHVFRSSELLASLTIPLKSLPNMEKVTKNYPLALASRSAGAVVSLSLEYINKAKAFQQEQERQRLGDDLERTAVMNERDEMIKIQTEAQMAADEASTNAVRAEEEARNLLEEARKKAEAAMAAAREEQEQGKAAVEAAMAEAQRAKEEADQQAAEAKRAQEEAQKLIEANRRIQEQSEELGQGHSSQFGEYRAMVQSGTPHDAVRQKMRDDGIEESSIAAFFDGINSYEQKIRQLQEEVDKLRCRPSKRGEAKTEDMPVHLDINQVKLLRRLLKLEKVQQPACIAVAADIPYEEAKQKVEEIAKRMGEIGSADATHPDPEIQRSLREEYYHLEQDMEKYNTALMLTDEYAAEEAREEREWEEQNQTENLKALKAIRRCMPVNIKNLSEAELASMKSPNGKVMTQDMARKFKCTNVLELLRMDPKDIMKSHPSLLETLRVTGLNVMERRALHVHLREPGAAWKLASDNDHEFTKRKLAWFTTLEDSYRHVVGAYNRHIAQYGPADNHPYATIEDSDIGCPLVGKQCPVRAALELSYDVDLGFPEDGVYTSAHVQKSVPARLVKNSGSFPSRPYLNSLHRANRLKRHYKNIRLAAEANGACESIDNALEMLESRQRGLFEARVRHELNKTESAATIAREQDAFADLVSDLLLVLQKLAKRGGVTIDAAQGIIVDKASLSDTRSSIECFVAFRLCARSQDCVDGMVERLAYLQLEDLSPKIANVRALITRFQGRNATTLSMIGKPNKPWFLRESKTRAELLKVAQETIRRERSAVLATPDKATRHMVDAMMAELLTTRGSDKASSANALKIRPCEVASARSTLVASANAMCHEKRGVITTKHLRWHAWLMRLIKRLWCAMTRRLKQQ